MPELFDMISPLKETRAAVKTLEIAANATPGGFAIVEPNGIDKQAEITKSATTTTCLVLTNLRSKHQENVNVNAGMQALSNWFTETDMYIKLVLFVDMLNARSNERAVNCEACSINWFKDANGISGQYIWTTREPKHVASI